MSRNSTTNGRKSVDMFSGSPFSSSAGIEELIRDLAPRTVLAQLGVPIKDGKILCYWHDDHSPSAEIYDDHFWCFPCGKRFDIANVVRKELGLSFLSAVDWLRNLADGGNTKQSPIRTLPDKDSKPSTYKGPLPLSWLDTTSPLPEEGLKYLSSRGITKETATRCGLRWQSSSRGNSIVIPYWRKFPLNSEIDIVQHRSAGESAKGKRFWGKTGYNRSSVLNAHVINPYLVVVLFGTFDAINALQDGIPAVSINGATQFGRNKDAIARIKSMFAGVERIVVVPDNDPKEYAPAQQLANKLGGEVAYFPETFEGKDYSDWHVSGRSADQFMKEVVGMDRFITENGKQVANNIMVALVEGRVSDVQNLSREFALDVAHAEGDGATMEAIMGILRHELAVSYSLGDFDVTVLENNQWASFAHALVRSKTVKEIFYTLRDYTEIAHSNRGGF